MLVLGNGPSLNAVPNVVLSKFLTFGSNGIFLKYLPDLYITISTEFFQHYRDEIKNLSPGIKFLSSQLWGKGLEGDSKTIYLPTVFPAKSLTRPSTFVTNPVMFSKNPAAVTYLGGTVIFAQLQLALYMGVSRVLLAGVDHNLGQQDEPAKRLVIRKKDPFHFSDSYLPDGATAHLDMIAANRSFSLALEAFRDSNVELWNVSESTKLDVIPRAKLDSFL